MKVLVPVEQYQGDSSILSLHFGKAGHYVILEIDNGNVRIVEVIENPKVRGIRPGELASELDIDAVIVPGGIGMKALEILRGRGVKIFSTSCRDLRCLMEELRKGELKPYTETPCPGEHSSR
ncbi:MAG: hypothetical protein GXO23_05930 [Crenarchaeota archaeon]|nr:hypothetical protein [Thermoproteota archaeon]